LSRVRVYNDDLFCYDQSPPKNTPNWACKPNNGDKTNPPQPARTEGMTQPRPIDRNAPTRPGGDYDVSLNYRVEDEHQYGESSAAEMIRGAIAEADARDQQIANDSLNLIFQHYTDEEYDDVEYFEDDF